MSPGGPVNMHSENNHSNIWLSLQKEHWGQGGQAQSWCRRKIRNRRAAFYFFFFFLRSKPMLYYSPELRLRNKK